MSEASPEIFAVARQRVRSWCREATQICNELVSVCESRRMSPSGTKLKLRPQEEQWCELYETITRRLFPEIVRWHAPRVGRDLVLLNQAEPYTAGLVADFIDRPSKPGLARLVHISRYLRGWPPLAIAITCRNNNIHYEWLLDEQDMVAAWRRRERTIVPPGSPPTTSGRITESPLHEMVRIGRNSPKYLYGSMAPETPFAIARLLESKLSVARAVEDCGLRSPRRIASYDLDGNNAFDILQCDSIIVKPLAESNGVGVIGPIRRDRPGDLRSCIDSSASQVSQGPPTILCEQYIDGTHYRTVSCRGKITIVARSAPASIRADGQSSVRDLLATYREQRSQQAFSTEALIQNRLLCDGLAWETIPQAGRLIVFTHDGSGDGSFIDETDSPPSAIIDAARSFGRFLETCPNFALDIILDEHGEAFIVDVSLKPALDYFSDTRRLYLTVEQIVMDGRAEA